MAKKKSIRNRVIYQSEALFVSPHAAGAHFICDAILTGLGPTGINRAMHGSLSGNAPALMSLYSPLGLYQDPAVANEIIPDSEMELPNYLLNAGVGYDLTDKMNKGHSLNAQEQKFIESGAFDITSVENLAFIQLLREENGFESLNSSPSFPGGFQWAGAIAVKYNPALTTPVFPGAGPQQLGPADSGYMYSYPSRRKWDEAYAQYLQTGSGPDVIHDKNNIGIGFLLHPFSGGYHNLIQQMHRVQSANYGYTINRTDVNEYGQLARIDAIALEPPTVNLDFTYFPTDGFNERNLGLYLQGEGSGVGMGAESLNASIRQLGGDFVIQGRVDAFGVNSRLLKKNNGGKNYFILTTPESTDAFNTADPVADRSVIALGNGFLSDYTLEASVGSIPTATAKVDFYNATSTIGTTGVAIPGINLAEGNPAKHYKFSLGHPSELRGDEGGAAPSTGTFGYAALSALRPGDITLELPEDLSMFAKISGDGAIHIQNFSLSLPLSRSPIDRLGTRFAFSRVVDLPVVATMSVSALISDVGEGNLALILDDCEEHDIKVTMKGNRSCVAGDSFDAMIIDFRGARIDSEAISSDIGSNKSIDFTFTTQIGGAGDLLHGVFISGANSNFIPEPHDPHNIHS